VHRVKALRPCCGRACREQCQTVRVNKGTSVHQRILRDRR
jgi:hypothetical protein